MGLFACSSFSELVLNVVSSCDRHASWQTDSFILPDVVKHVPAWMPGAGFKRKAREWRKLSRELIERPFAMVKRKMVSKALRSPSCHSLCLSDALYLGRGHGDSVVHVYTPWGEHAPGR
jgi:hypothetical protein